MAPLPPDDPELDALDEALEYEPQRDRLPGLPLGAAAASILLVNLAVFSALPDVETTARMITGVASLVFFVSFAYLLMHPQPRRAIVFEAWAWIGTMALTLMHLDTLFGAQSHLLLGGMLPGYSVFMPGLTVYAWIVTPARRLRWHAGIYCGLAAAASLVHTLLYWTDAASHHGMIYLGLTTCIVNPLLLSLMYLHGRLLRRGARALLDSLDRSRQIMADADHSRFHDPVTGLYNRDGLSKALGEDLQAHPSVAVMMLAIERGDLLANALGEAGFDQVLRELGRQLEAGLGDESRLARRQGTHFVVWAPGLAGEEAAERAQALFDRMCAHDFLTRQPLRFSAGLFISEGPADPQFVIDQVSFGLSRAQDEGGGRLWIS